MGGEGGREGGREWFRKGKEKRWSKAGREGGREGRKAGLPITSVAIRVRLVLIPTRQLIDQTAKEGGREGGLTYRVGGHKSPAGTHTHAATH